MESKCGYCSNSTSAKICLVKNQALNLFELYTKTFEISLKTKLFLGNKLKPNDIKKKNLLKQQSVKKKQAFFINS